MLAPVADSALPYYLCNRRKIYFGLHGSLPAVGNPHGQPVLIARAFEPGGACTCTARARPLLITATTGDELGPPEPWASQPDCLGHCLQVTLWVCECFPLTMDELLYSFRQHFGVNRHLSVYPPGFSRAVPPIAGPHGFNDFHEFTGLNDPGGVDDPDVLATLGDQASLTPPGAVRHGQVLPETVWLEEQMHRPPDPSLYEPFFPGWISRRTRRLGGLHLQDPRRIFDLTADRCLRRILAEHNGSARN